MSLRTQQRHFGSMGKREAIYPACRVSLTEKVTDGLFHHIAADLGNRPRQRNVLWADLHAVLRVSAFLDSAIAHQRRQSFAFQGRACGMGVEQPHLRDRRRAHESGVFVELRTASMQQQHEMHRESGYASSWSASSSRGPEPRS